MRCRAGPCRAAALRCRAGPCRSSTVHIRAVRPRTPAELQGSAGRGCAFGVGKNVSGADRRQREYSPAFLLLSRFSPHRSAGDTHSVPGAFRLFCAFLSVAKNSKESLNNFFLSLRPNISLPLLKILWRDLLHACTWVSRENTQALTSFLE